MHNLFKNLKLLVNRLSEFFLLFSQVLSFQLAFYPIVFLGFLLNFKNLVKSKVTTVSVLFILTIATSLYFRGASIEILVTCLQYYLGILLVLIYFTIDKNLSIRPWLIYSFIGLIFYEVISSNILGELAFFYDDPKDAIDNLAIQQIGFARAKTTIGFYRAFGPALNASISGSILAVLFFILFDQRNSNVSKTIIVLVFFAFVFSASNTAFVVFLSLCLMLALKKIMNSPLFFLPISIVKFIGWGLISIIPAYLIYISYLWFFDLEGLKNPWTLDSLRFVINDKKYMFSHIQAQSENIFFGRDMSSIDHSQIGGDTLIFNMIKNLGLFGLLGLFSILMWSCEKGNRIYIIAGFIATSHYGAVFTLSGQFFFGALAANAILRKN